MRKNWPVLVLVLGPATFITCAQQMAVGTDRPAAVMPAKDEVEMVFIPAGEFVMGSDDPEADNDEKPVSKISVGGFWIDDLHPAGRAGI
jgi:formylglycine-generating enzyme required for sulfatase activity